MTDNFQHKELAQGRWFLLDIVEQMGNIGSEVSRAINWKNKNNQKLSINAFYRALELIYLTVEDEKNKKRLHELLIMREALCDFFVGENNFKSTDQSWLKYFNQFGLAARNKNQINKTSN